MNKIFGLVLGVFVFALLVGMVSAVPMTVVYGQVMDADNNPVAGVDVEVTCTHNSVDTLKIVQTNDAGKYYAFFGSTECNNGDTAVAHTDGAEDLSGTVTDEKCRVGTLEMNLQIPEFGAIAGAVALVGALGIFLYRRNN
ncbi:MAG: hypothetical protein ACP5OA_06550 [Candidatus Woesearchaeota archaeon]